MKHFLTLAELGYIRTKYLDKLWPLVTIYSLAKVIVGQRRSGKSTILKQLLSQLIEKKYYLNDLGFKNFFSSQFDPGLTKNLENYVFNALKTFGYAVYVGHIGPLEIDFVAEKDRKTRYFQATYLLSTEKVVEREYGNFLKCKDQWPKAVISLDALPLPDKEGIQHIRAWELEAFLEALLNPQPIHRDR